MSLTELVTDPYNRRARLQPALLAILPVGLVTLILFPGLESKAGTLLGLAAYFGGATWLTQVGRERGKKLQPKLYESWGGMPSVSMLRHRDTHINKITKERYHAVLSANIPDLTLPSAEEERNDPAAADDVYTSVTDWLLNTTRGKPESKLIFEENMNYGFRRNFWALRYIAVFVDFALFFFVVIMHTTIIPESNSVEVELNTTAFAAIAVISLHLTAVLSSTKSWVRTTANAYAKQLLAACDSMNKKSNNTQH